MRNFNGFVALVFIVTALIFAFLVAYPIPVGANDDTNAPPKPAVSSPVTVDTNAFPPQVIGITNGAVTFNSKLIGYIKDSTNFVPVPDLQALSSSHDNGFALGVRYGAVASRRNPDVSDWAALVEIARNLMTADQQQQVQQAQKAKLRK